MRNRPVSLLLATASVGLSLAIAITHGQSTDQKGFPTPSAAVKALMSALRGDDTSALQAIFGPDGADLVSSGDDVADKSARANFVKSYDLQHKLLPKGAETFVLSVGASDFALPIPIVKKDGAWTFDTAAGKQEALYRRIGRNELETIRVMHAIIAAEREYAAGGHDGNPPGLYAGRIRSEPGKENGLFWEPKEGEQTSPAGPLLAEAAEGGYDKPISRHTPFHGYLYRILSAQGPHARGGARDYLSDGKLTGFAVVAYPAEYGSSGVMTFLTSLGGVVYQKDLGADTAEQVKAMTSFDPDSTWKRAE